MPDGSVGICGSGGVVVPELSRLMSWIILFCAVSFSPPVDASGVSEITAGSVGVDVLSYDKVVS